MNGWVDVGGRALVRIAVNAAAQSPPMDLDAWIDTGFTGELVLPQTVVEGMRLPQSGTVGAELGDGSSAMMRTYTCLIEWFGRQREIQVVANEGQCSLLGVGLLHDHRLTVDYRSRTVVIE